MLSAWEVNFATWKTMNADNPDRKFVQEYIRSERSILIDRKTDKTDR